MLTFLIKSMGISTEVFIEQIHKGLNIQEHKKLFYQIILVDNFNVFKKLMIKRNKELELKAIESMQADSYYN